MTVDEKRQIIRFMLAIFTGIAFFGMLALLAFKAIPEENRDIFVGFSGFLGGAFMTIMGFYFTDTDKKQTGEN